MLVSLLLKKLEIATVLVSFYLSFQQKSIMYPYVLSVLNQFLHLLRVLRGLLNSLGYALSATAGAAVTNINFSVQMMLLHYIQNLPKKLGQQSAICWNSLGLFRESYFFQTQHFFVFQDRKLKLFENKFREASQNFNSFSSFRQFFISIISIR